MSGVFKVFLKGCSGAFQIIPQRIFLSLFLEFPNFDQ
jgi:hypothetical protein